MASDIPQCTRCGLKAATGGRSKCANCGLEFGKTFVPVKTVSSGPIAPPIGALPKCLRCGSIGKTGHKNCVFCGLTYGETGGTSKGASTEGPVIPKTLPRCLRCGTIGKGGHKNCVFCGLGYGESPGTSKGATTEGPKDVSKSTLPRCSRCKALGSAGSSKCNFCGKIWSDEDWSGGDSKDLSTRVLTGPVTVPPSALPKCSRCKSWGKLSSDKCTFCGKHFESGDYGGGSSSGSDKKDTPVLSGPSDPSVSVLPKCSRCGSIGKLSSDKCTFCSKPFTNEDYGGKAPSKTSSEPKCEKCGSKGLVGASKCAYCGHIYGQEVTVTSTPSYSTSSTTTHSTPTTTRFTPTTTHFTPTTTHSTHTTTHSTPTTTHSTHTTAFLDNSSTTEAPAFCGCCGTPSEGGAFCGVCGEPF